MTHRIDASMQLVQASREHPAPYRFFADPHLAQLMNRDDAMLSARDLSDRRVGSGDFPVHAKG
jgi:hypothetical protein